MEIYVILPLEFEIEINTYFTASSPPLGGPTPEIDPYARQTHNWREPKALRLEKEKKIFCCEFDLWSQPRHWSEFIHEFISRHRVGSRVFPAAQTGR